MDWYKAKIVDIKPETNYIKRFFIQIPDMNQVSYIPGQYIQINFPIESKKTYRQYSIAAPPAGNNIVELLIVLDPKGLATNYMFNEVDLGSELQVSRVMGNFVMPDKIERDMCFISTGTGLAPLRAMYLEILNKGLTDKKIDVVFGTRFKKDLIYKDEIKHLEEKHPNFKFYPVLSREDSVDWNGYKGYVHNVYKELYPGPDKRPADFYICGWKEMVRETRQSLMNFGYERKSIHFERYS
jgi:ferredoxin-NADP reductase